MTPPIVDDIAPDFSASDQNGTIHKLTDYTGRWVLLYFYPKDDTPGCTKEACSMRDNYAALQKNEVAVLGVSKDSTKSHTSFATKYDLPFTLLSDPEGVVIGLYGADGVILPKRVSYLIRPDGTIAKVYNPVQAATHAEDVLKDLPELQKQTEL